MLAFGGLAAVLSALIAVAAYEITRSTLISQRERVAERQTFVNARAVDNALTGSPEQPADALADAQTSAQGFALLRVQGEWISSSVAGGSADLPDTLVEALDDGDVARQRVILPSGAAVAVGVPLAGVAGGTAYVEFVPMDELAASLNRVRQGLILAAVSATGVGVLAGWWASQRILRPVRRMADAANRISEGALDRRLESDGDADLEGFVHSFNEMVDGLQLRIEREARFASDVSHELRTPLATMLSALSVARRRVTEPAGAQALAVLQSEVDRFTQLMTDLLEISRVEAGVAELVLEEVAPRDLVAQALDASGHREVPVVVEPSSAALVLLDRRRMGQVLVNLLQNADHYAGGATAVRIAGDEQVLRFLVDDAGPGIPPERRSAVFDRFVRSSDPSVPGTGLGLALVREHVRLHGGTVEVLDAPGGGARFAVTIPRAATS
jgi:signal transduction histidine kinase